MRAIRWFGTACVVLGTGCATTPERPLAAETVVVGRARATYRDFVGAHRNLCDAEQRWLEEELVSVNGLLADWLEHTEGTRDDDWPPAKLELLEEGAHVLPKVLDVHEANLNALKRCSFAESRGFPRLVRSGLEYVSEARQRVASAKDLREWLAYRERLERWRVQQPVRKADAGTLCSPRPKVGAAELYYAFTGEDGVTTFLFCDGAKVIESPSGETKFQKPLGASKRELKRLRLERYLEAAKKLNAQDIDRPPSPPARVYAGADAANP
ncbi:MAG: hypothetical protein IRZ16_07410 [Myxococcaceae bacterium]|nr:hypothetical protein [Myxococcaceae bacterium]